MISYRYGTFETNSSSVHTITMCPKDDYDKWANGETYLYNDRFITLDEAITFVNEKREKYEEDPIDWDNMSDDEVSDELKEWEIYSIDSYGYGEYEFYEEDYTTTSGETIVAFGYYGHD